MGAVPLVIQETLPLVKQTGKAERVQLLGREGGRWGGGSRRRLIRGGISLAHWRWILKGEQVPPLGAVAALGGLTWRSSRCSPRRAPGTHQASWGGGGTDRRDWGGRGSKQGEHPSGFLCGQWASVTAKRTMCWRCAVRKDGVSVEKRAQGLTDMQQTERFGV